MVRTTISIDEQLLQNLHRLAAERRLSLAALIREALEEKLASSRPKPRSLGIGSSGHPDTSILAGEQRPEPRSWR